jgi:hypothetical protein
VAPARTAAALLGHELLEFDFTARLFQLFERCPKLDDVTANLCLECHAEILNCAVSLLDELDCQFVATGEVLNQNGVTQSEESLISAASYTGKPMSILRPLSARRLPISEPERRGWVDRRELGDVEGVRQSQQVEWANRFGIAQENFDERGPSPLADPRFVARLQDLRGHEGLSGKRSFALLTLGRHFRLGPVTKLIVGRTAAEDAELESTAELYELVIKAETGSGPTGLLPILATDDHIMQAAGLSARISGAGSSQTMTVRSPRGTVPVQVEPASQAAMDLVEIRPPSPPANPDG